MLVFLEGEKPESPEKNPRSKDKNQQQPQPTYEAGSGNRTRATLVGGECSHHCAIPAPLVNEDKYVCIYTFCLVLGTREEKSASEANDWYKPIANLLKKLCRCCQGYQTREESDRWRHESNRAAKRGSIVESRTSIKTELANSSSKVRFGSYSFHM